ncbi:MAG: PASTA domain-containing protein [Cyclobacteriaceae bacterium]|nr:PASTA domain-containing protein [Cyclobacteriaceae bacterium SS2]
MKLISANKWYDILKHIALMGFIGILLVLFFFYIYMPFSTNHGETLTVPDVRGVAFEDLDKFLGERKLRYEVTEDSGFSADLPPLSVLRQLPLPNAKVKENRKIYVTLNAEKPPLVRMPKLIGGSVKNAQLILKTYDLRLGNIDYQPDIALNYVLDQKIDGRRVLEGERIPKGSSIDLVAGDGMGKVSLESPNLIFLDQESAEFAIIGSGLKIGDVTYEKTGMAVIEVEKEDGTIEYEQQEASPGAVFKQRPNPGINMRIGQEVDIWIYKPDSVNVNPTLLDE